MVKHYFSNKSLKKGGRGADIEIIILVATVLSWGTGILLRQMPHGAK